MWPDILGGIMFLAGSVVIGAALSANCRLRPVQLSAVSQMLNMLESEIKYMSSRLGSALQRTGELSGDKTSVFFTCAAEIVSREKTSAYDAWVRSINMNLRSTSLKKEDADVLKEFGRMLGNTDIDGQLRNIRHTKACIEVQYRKALDEQTRNEGMYRGLGLMVGLAGLIIMI